ncbi:GSCFA domain-containing protein [Dyadobacter fermentans]|uniref:GSCFA domain protein n=1 Tax=Dyadobacter fermentans (strain ATCC 700827 / DSM 18053 / CIP 107007 / KCTC 52180 / NS114) TaxID=471854 RepID=C6W6S3_DYAFD|nr:GSCFA domain-containing protein [Dyadobacter fermentans]ACT96134.1 GSCFA domain protein [Dyadobacter fermentans DSM 18053]
MKDIKLSTEVALDAPEWKVDHQTKILTIGSCFAEVLGGQLADFKFDVLNNSLGTVFNPLTICKILDSAVEEKRPNPALFLQNPDHIWMHHDFHSSQWAHGQGALDAHLSDKLDEIREFLGEADLLVVTLGTAYAYRHRKTNLIVGNCHKVPGDRFIKELLHPDQITIAFEQLIQKLIPFNRKLRILLTVSPVRHTRDTLPLNQVSKSTLRLVTHRLSEKYKHVEYFPSYEIMIDELRDYRFYKEDMIHPSSIAEDYVFNAFAQNYIDAGSLKFMSEWSSIRNTLAHRPQHGLTQGHLKMLKSLWSKLNAFSRNLDVSAEMEEVERRIGEFPGM